MRHLSFFLDYGMYYGIPAIVIWGVYLGLMTKKAEESKNAHKKTLKTGMTEPASLHPVIDYNICLGCGSCINACPEQDSHQVLGLIKKKSHLISPAYCIGHGACRTACPHGAITLVFGSQERGVDIPEVNPCFETNVEGIYIAGELGGMGLIRNAIEQGRRAMESIVNKNGAGDGSQLDVLIVGAGPAGFSASLAARQHKLHYVTVEQESLGGTVFHYPRNKLVMTGPAELPTHGKVMFREITKEKLLDFWGDVEKKSGVKINYKERVESIVKHNGGFEVKTSADTYRAHTILLAIGRRGTPRKLGVPGENKTKVVYSLTDPEQYMGKHVLVVGGGDSALETAMSLANEPDTTVTLSYRSAAFSRAKEGNRLKLEAASTAGKVSILMNSNLKQIEDTLVRIDHEGETIELQNDAVIINAGGIIPTEFLRKLGISVETKYGTP